MTDERKTIEQPEDPQHLAEEAAPQDLELTGDEAGNVIGGAPSLGEEGIIIVGG